MKRYRLFDTATGRELLGIYAKSERAAKLLANRQFGIWYYTLIPVVTC